MTPTREHIENLKSFYKEQRLGEIDLDKLEAAAKHMEWLSEVVDELFDYVEEVVKLSASLQERLTKIRVEVR